MALYAIGDLHLSLGADKPMDVFGGAWEGYTEKLRGCFQQMEDDDVIVLCGDVSWGMTLEEALADFRFLNELPGRKILLKGNHDYWWTTASKMNAFFSAHGLHKLGILHNNCHQYGETALCGTRGWFLDEKGGKVFRRELIRLEASLTAAGDRAKLCFLHYPPRYQGYLCAEIVALLERYGVTLCCFGHLHGPSHRLAVEGVIGGVEYRLVAADYIRFEPVLLLP